MLASAIAALLAAACRQTIGIDQYSNVTTSACGLPYGTNACASCVNASCCGESSTCAADPVCAAYENCLGKCNGDPKCRSQCTIDNPVGTASDVSALSACLASKCETPCGLECGGIAGYVSEPSSAPSCQSCIETNACDHARAVATSIDGDAYWRCVLACPTEDCRLTCGTDNPSGASLFAPFNQDYSGVCKTPCAYGNYWACVGHVNWPVARSKTFVRSDSVFDPNLMKGVPGLDVSICTLCPCGISSPILAQTQTDDAGVFTFPPVIQVLGANGIGTGIGLDGCLQITSTSMSYVPEFAYWGYPISEPVVVNTADFHALVLTPSGLANSSLIGVTQDPMRGFVGAIVKDCVGSSAPGVRVTTSSNDPLITTYYYQPVGSKVESTQASGTAVFFNVPPGLVTLTATPLAGC